LYERLGFTHVDTFNPGWDPTFIAERLDVMSRDVVLAPARNDTVPIQEVSVQTACH
ncbi:GNAT family N-acetyltransferase, partial [Pseudomonas aeruginosa]